MTDYIKLKTDYPQSGYFISVGPLPIDAPPVLVGGGGTRAVRLFDIGGHNALYSFEGLAEQMGDGRRRLSVPSTEEDKMVASRPFAAATPLAQHVSALVPRIQAGAETLSNPKITPTIDSASMVGFQLDYDSDQAQARLDAWIPSYLPIVWFSGWVKRKDGQSEQMGSLEVTCEEPMEVHPDPDSLHLTSGLREWPRFGIVPIRFALVSKVARLTTDDIEEPVIDEHLAEFLQNPPTTPLRFLPTDWVGDWMGCKPMDTEYGLAEVLARELDESFPFSSEIGANQPGSQPSLGATFSAPLWTRTDPAVIPDLLRGATDWALRPVHFCEPGTNDPIQVTDEIETVGRQVYGKATGRFADLPLPTFGMRGYQNRTSHDEQHMADMPLLAAYACTGDPCLRWIIEQHAGLDLMQRRPRSDYRNGGRGEGRTGASLLAASQMVADHTGLAEKLEQHVAKRLEIATRKSDTAQEDHSAVVRPLDLISGQLPGHWQCDEPVWMPYEEATFAWSSWRLWALTGSQDALLQAYRSGLAVAAACFQEPDGSWVAAYAMTYLPDGKPLPDEELRADSRYVHRGGRFIWWAAVGLRVLLSASRALDGVQHESHQPFVDRALRAVMWIDMQEPINFADAHHALHGVGPVL